MKYQVWIKAHDPKTLAVIGEVLIFEHEDRLVAEQRAEGDLPLVDGALYFGDYVLVQKPLYRTENRIPGWGTTPGPSSTNNQRCECSNKMESQIFRGRCVYCSRVM